MIYHSPKGQIRNLGRKVKQILGRISYQGHVTSITVWRIARAFTERISHKRKKISPPLSINWYFSIHRSEKIVFAPKPPSRKILLHFFWLKKAYSCLSSPSGFINLWSQSQSQSYSFFTLLANIPIFPIPDGFPFGKLLSFSVKSRFSSGVPFVQSVQHFSINQNRSF